jgi:hypothetical protein
MLVVCGALALAAIAAANEMWRAVLCGPAEIFSQSMRCPEADMRQAVFLKAFLLSFVQPTMRIKRCKQYRHKAYKLRCAQRIESVSRRDVLRAFAAQGPDRASLTWA